MSEPVSQAVMTVTEVAPFQFAIETAAGNIDAARVATAANRVNQITPYGSLKYDITGADPYGNPTYTATQSLSPQQQQLLDYSNKTSIGLGQLADNPDVSPNDTFFMPPPGLRT